MFIIDDDLVVFLLILFLRLVVVVVVVENEDVDDDEVDPIDFPSLIILDLQSNCPGLPAAKNETFISRIREDKTINNGLSENDRVFK